MFIYIYIHTYIHMYIYIRLQNVPLQNNGSHYIGPKCGKFQKLIPAPKKPQDISPLQNIRYYMVQQNMDATSEAKLQWKGWGHTSHPSFCVVKIMKIGNTPFFETSGYATVMFPYDCGKLRSSKRNESPLRTQPQVTYKAYFS